MLWRRFLTPCVEGTSSRYALMLLLVTAVVLACAAATWALDVPPLTGRVVDQAGILSAADRERLTATLAAHEQATRNQVAVLIIPSLEGDDLFSFSHRVATTWHLGAKGADNGVLLLVAVKDRKVRLEVGYGLEGALTDARTAQIIRHAIVPHFRQGDFAAGIAAGVDAVLKSLTGTEDASPGSTAPVIVQRDLDILAVFGAVFAGLVAGLLVSRLNRVVGGLAGAAVGVAVGPWLWPAVMAGGASAVATYILSGAMQRSAGGSSRRRRARDDGWWYSTNDGGWHTGQGGGWSGGGDTGFSGGGGDFGGGGASGDW